MSGVTNSHQIPKGLVRIVDEDILDDGLNNFLHLIILGTNPRDDLRKGNQELIAKRTKNKKSQ